MKMPLLFAAAVALSACSSTSVEQSTETLKPSESLDIAKASSADAPRIEPAKQLVRTQNAAPSDAVCNRGAMSDTRSFIICRDGTLRKAGVVTALSAPNDPNLTIEEVAATYDVAPQIFTGIQSATYGTLVNGNRQAPRRAGKHKAQTGLVQIQGKIYEVYQLSSGGKTGTIFVEQKSAQ